MSSLIPFEYEGKQVRIVEQDGEPWFVAADICAVLDISKHRDAITKLDDDERGSVRVDTLGGPQDVAAISEPGMYKLALRSDKPNAKPFIRFVTHDVLPSIRKTGAYVAPNAPVAQDTLNAAVSDWSALKHVAADFFNDKNQILLAVNKAIRTRHNVDFISLLGQEKQAPLQLVAPTNKPLLTPSEIGVALNMTAQAVNKRLVALCLQIKDRAAKGYTFYRLTEAGQQYGVYLDVGKAHGNGTPVRQLKWTDAVLKLLQAA